jgi:hypothetical protein
MSFDIQQADALDYLRSLESDSVDLVLCSPPYEAARTYSIDFNLKGQAWVDWAVARYLECVRVSRGLVAWVVEGQTRQFRWSATPALMMADLHRFRSDDFPKGIKLRKPPVFHRVGIPGSGGPDWLRNDFEWIVCASKGKLPWSDNTAMGHPPKWAPGGEMSHMLTDGTRKNQWGGSEKSTGGERKRNGELRQAKPRPSHSVKSKKQLRAGVEPKVDMFIQGGMPPGSKLHTKNNGDEMRVQCYTPPKLANPGNVLKFIVGGGVMGSPLCHENEAPFPETLAEFFILSFCPPNGTVLDCFSGSGTTSAVALRHGRNFQGCDIRESQVELTKRRVAEVQKHFTESA